MTNPRHLTGLSEIAAEYDALLCDAWGVIHDGKTLFPGVVEALSRFRETRGPVVILTNAPRLSTVIPKQLDRIGMPREAWDDIVTSGDATARVVAHRPNARFFRLGPEKDESLFENVDVEFVPFEDADTIFCSGLMDDLSETPEDYRPLLKDAAARKMTMVCANPDKIVKFGDRWMYCAGALGDLYEELGGEVVLCGKPHRPIYDAAREALMKAGATEGARILAIGDGLETDILGANREGLDVCFVADGIFGDEARASDGSLDGDRLRRLLGQYDVKAQYAMEGLSW